jgi:hypothetical protein
MKPKFNDTIQCQLCLSKGYQNGHGIPWGMQVNTLVYNNQSLVFSTIALPASTYTYLAWPFSCTAI